MNSMHARSPFSVSVGGSLFFGDSLDLSRIRALADSIIRLHRAGHSFILVCGGGKPARNYVAASKRLGASAFVQDELGIALTRVNARLFMAALGSRAYPRVLESLSEVPLALNAGKIPVLGGLLPSLTTDAVCALAAESVGGRMINLTNVDGVFDADPRTNKSARLLSSVSYDDLLKLLKNSGMVPGQQVVLDLPCVLVLRRSKIPAFVLNGSDGKNFEACVKGKKFKGTRIG
ncbi:MAG: UMP kinase [Candidatus Diapherotrites archaeon]|nr:UMP kinase [Candidatus Diapherotrites archaeon]